MFSTYNCSTLSEFINRFFTLIHKKYFNGSEPPLAFCISVRYAHYFIAVISLSTHLIVIKNLLPKIRESKGTMPPWRSPETEPPVGFGATPQQKGNINSPFPNRLLSWLRNGLLKYFSVLYLR